MHAEEQMNDRERLMLASGWQRLLFRGQEKGHRRHHRRYCDTVHRKKDNKDSRYIHRRNSSLDRLLEFQPAQMGGGYWPLSHSSSMKSADIYMLQGGNDGGSTGVQKKSILSIQRHQSMVYSKYPISVTDQRERRRHSQGCLNFHCHCYVCCCGHCHYACYCDFVKDPKMERRKGEEWGACRSKLQSRQKRPVMDHQGSDGVSCCCSSEALKVSHISLSDHKDVTVMATNIHEASGPMSRGDIHNTMDGDIGVNNNVPHQKSLRKSVSCSDLCKPPSPNSQPPNVGSCSPHVTSTISSSNIDADFEECHGTDAHTMESRIRALYERIALGKEKLAMVLGGSCWDTTTS